MMLITQNLLSKTFALKSHFCSEAHTVTPSVPWALWLVFPHCIHLHLHYLTGFKGTYSLFIGGKLKTQQDSLKQMWGFVFLVSFYAAFLLFSPPSCRQMDIDTDRAAGRRGLENKNERQISVRRGGEKRERSEAAEERRICWVSDNLRIRLWSRNRAAPSQPLPTSAWHSAAKSFPWKLWPHPCCLRPFCWGVNDG